MFAFVLTSIHLSAKAYMEDLREGLNAQAMNWDIAKLQKW